MIWVDMKWPAVIVTHKMEYIESMYLQRSRQDVKIIQNFQTKIVSVCESLNNIKKTEMNFIGSAIL